jgi:hypothetical protein
VALHMHERISTQTILRVLAREDVERDLFDDPQHDYAIDQVTQRVADIVEPNGMRQLRKEEADNTTPWRKGAGLLFHHMLAGKLFCHLPRHQRRCTIDSVPPLPGTAQAESDFSRYRFSHLTDSSRSQARLRAGVGKNEKWFGNETCLRLQSGMRQYHPILGFVRPIPNSARQALRTGVEKNLTAFFGNQEIPLLQVNMDINNRPSIATKGQNRLLGNNRTTGCSN